MIAEKYKEVVRTTYDRFSNHDFMTLRHPLYHEYRTLGHAYQVQPRHPIFPPNPLVSCHESAILFMYFCYLFMNLLSAAILERNISSPSFSPEPRQMPPDGCWQLLRQIRSAKAGRRRHQEEARRLLPHKETTHTKPPILAMDVVTFFAYVSSDSKPILPDLPTLYAFLNYSRHQLGIQPWSKSSITSGVVHSLFT